MEIIEYSLTEDQIEQNDYKDDYSLTINFENNNNFYLNFIDGEAEDNNLMRNFNDCYWIKEVLIEAYNAGKRNENLIIKEDSII